MACVNDRFPFHHPCMEMEEYLVDMHSHRPHQDQPFMEMRWVKERVLGKGSYGVVYLAIPVNPNLPYLAVKSARLQDSSSLQKESRILQKLSGSSEIVSCFGIEVSSENALGLVCNLLLEYAPGGTLADLIKRSGGRLLEGEVKRYTRTILKGLCSIHAKGYVHCDLKPANILVFPTQEGRNDVKIADFGLTKEPLDGLLYGNISYKFRFRGTPVYMSPESVAEGEIEAPLDIWSLGCIVIEMFTGKQAMRWFNAEMLMFELAVLKATPRIPDTMSVEGRDFLMKCFATNPRERWTARMLLNHPYMRDEVIPTGPPLITTVLPPIKTEPLSAEHRVEKAQESPLDSLPPPGWCDFSSVSLPSICYPELVASN